MRTIAGKPFWKRNSCGALGAITLRNHETAIGENLAGNTLDQLTKEGRELLEEYGKND